MKECQWKKSQDRGLQLLHKCQGEAYQKGLKFIKSAFWNKKCLTALTYCCCFKSK